jgi:hypothetical protein
MGYPALQTVVAPQVGGTTLPRRTKVVFLGRNSLLRSVWTIKFMVLGIIHDFHHHNNNNGRFISGPAPAELPPLAPIFHADHAGTQEQFVSGERVRVRVRMPASSLAGHLARVVDSIQLNLTQFNIFLTILPS